MNKRKLSSAFKTKQYKSLIEDAGLKLASTDRQLANGSIKLVGSFRQAGRNVQPTYVITANGAVISNEFTARRVDGYREGFAAVRELVEKRFGV